MAISVLLNHTDQSIMQSKKSDSEHREYIHHYYLLSTLNLSWSEKLVVEWTDGLVHNITYLVWSCEGIGLVDDYLLKKCWVLYSDVAVEVAATLFYCSHPKMGGSRFS